MGRYRISLAVMVGLVPLAVPMPARAARGSFVYWSVGPGGDPNGRPHRLDDPPTGPCADLAGPDQAGTQVVKVENDTDTQAIVFENTGCTGHRLVVAAKQTRSAGGHGPHSFSSVRFRAE